MNNPTSQSDSKQRIDHILSTLYRYRTHWIAPAIIAMVLSAIYVVALRSETWSAKQSLIVRDDLLGQSFKPGRFDSIESMKSAQETILEIARKPQVIRKALEQLGPESKGWFGWGNRDWPSDETIESVQGKIAFNAPNGAEFGKTEVIVLNTKASSRERSRKFIELLLNEIIVKVDEVRALRLQSMESELIQARDAAMLALEESKAKLQEMDENLGSDFGAMASLNDSQSSGHTIKRDISQIRLEKRATDKELESLKIALSQLKAAKQNPKQIFTTSAALIKLLPAFDDYKKALIKTKEELAMMAGKYQPAHPSYREAKGQIEAMKQQMYLELDSSIAGIQEDITLAENRILRLNLEMEGLDGRLVNLGSMRADLMTLGADLNKRVESANNAQKELSEIQGLAQATNAELITRVDEPQVSTRPDGMGKKATVLACGLGGLMLGLGFVMLIAPPLGSEPDNASASRRGGNSAEAQDQTPESFFDSKTFERIIVSAATAATTAVQSAAKARQFFIPSKPEHENTPDGNSPEAPAMASQGAPDPTSIAKPENANRDVVETEATSADELPQKDAQLASDTPSVEDLLEAANEIATPAPVASRPLSPPPRRIQIQPIVEKEKTATSKITVQPVSPTPQPVSDASAENVSVSELSIKDAASKPASELAAIQLAALKGTRVQPSSDLESPSTLPQPSTPEPLESETASELQPSIAEVPSANREQPQTIVLSDMTKAALMQIDEDDSNSEPIASLSRRGPNVRPVDLAKSATDEDSTFVRINFAAGESESKKEKPDSEKSESSEPAKSGVANPFLENRSPGSADGGQNPTDPDDISSMAVPDQIQKLSDSIARFANPEKQDD